jgi:antirestriction protein ArdC
MNPPRLGDRSMTRNIHQEIADKIVSMMEKDGVNWVKSWTGAGTAGRPTNVTTGKRYQGINTVMLMMAAQSTDYPTNIWATYQQWQAKGAQVRKGKHGTGIIKFVELQDETKLDKNGDPTRFGFLKGYSVFNASQVDGYAIPVAARPSEAEAVLAADLYVAATGAVIHYGCEHAVYSPATDTIRMPDRERFLAGNGATATENFYSVLFHELTHWTASKARCDRDLSKRFGSEGYAFEEIIAQLGAAFLGADIGIEAQPSQQHAGYINSWIAAIKKHPNAVVTAASAASKAVDFLDALQPAAEIADAAEMAMAA